MTENPKEYDLIGTVHVVQPAETHGKFTKRVVVLVVQREKRDAYISLEATYERIRELDGVNPGDELHVKFMVDGREWHDPRTGATKYFSDLALSRFKVLRKAPPRQTSSRDMLDEVPF